jgi:DNA-binding CsgD family transcriptional regulator
MSLSRADLTSLVQGLHALYAGGDTQDTLTRALAVLEDWITVEYLGFFGWILTAPPVLKLVVQSKPLVDEALMPEFQAGMLTYPITGHFTNGTSQGAVRTSDFPPGTFDEHRARHPTVYGKLGMEQVLTMPVYIDADGFLAICLVRSAPAFSERDRTMLNLLQSHLRQAYVNARERESVQTRSVITGLALLGLTQRQADVAAALALGKKNGEIATALRMSPRTVEKHVEQIFRRLGVNNRVQASNLLRAIERP